MPRSRRVAQFQIFRTIRSADSLSSPPVAPLPQAVSGAASTLLPVAPILEPPQVTPSAPLPVLVPFTPRPRQRAEPPSAYSPPALTRLAFKIIRSAPWTRWELPQLHRAGLPGSMQRAPPECLPSATTSSVTGRRIIFGQVSPQQPELQRTP